MNKDNFEEGDFRYNAYFKDRTPQKPTQPTQSTQSSQQSGTKKGSNDEVLFALLSAVTKQLGNNNTPTPVTVQPTHPAQRQHVPHQSSAIQQSSTTQSVQSVQPVQPKAEERDENGTTQVFDIEDDVMKKKHKKSKSKKEEITVDSTETNEGIAKLHKAVNDLPQVAPLVSFASQTNLEQLSQSSVQSVSQPVSQSNTQSEQLAIGNEQKKDEVKQIQAILKEANEIKQTLSQNSQQQSSQQINQPGTKNVEKDFVSSPTENENNTNKITYSNNIMEQQKQAQTEASSVDQNSNVQTNTAESVESNDVFSFVNLKENLGLLASVKENDKLGVDSNGNLYIDTAPAGTVKRWWCGEGREQTHTIIRKVIRSANVHSEELINDLKSGNGDADKLRNLNSLTEKLSAAKQGTLNLVITYRADPGYKDKFIECMEDIIVRAYKNMNYNQTN